MLTSKCVTNKSENKTRKYWLVSTFFFLVFFPLVDLAISAILSPIPIPKEVLADCPAKVTIGIIQAIFLWHCAYRNHGTKLLSFYLVAGPLLVMISMVSPLADDTTTASGSGDAYTITTSLIALFGFFWWFLLSLKMKNVNKAIQARILEKAVSPVAE